MPKSQIADLVFHIILQFLYNLRHHIKGNSRFVDFVVGHEENLLVALR